MRFSLVIPCYNEGKNIPLLLERCKVLALNSDVEVILVDNGSTDNTAEVLESLLPQYPGCRSIRVDENQGYGFGIVSGLRSAKGDVLGWTHADMQTDPYDFYRGLQFFESQGYDIFVKGRRYGRPWTDVLFTLGMSVFESVLLARPMWDINAQPTMFSRDFFESWDAPPDDFSLDLYAYYQAKVRGLRVYRFSVRFGERANGVSHWNVNWVAKRKFIQRTIAFSLKLKKRI
ncbi:glycosyltransferase family 2 protein [Pseudomonas oryzihabitans]|uniref:glycosyltransferase family 2 protein n=1 Tax=Pseudomonas oryzihabitans TaxID=47885 RepID=UPI00285E1C2F|nr:glycosyltransferase family 2 protein [Pseudomonas psychrotolerans]MDR6676684.1 glycosyltransferase involved in cell wall biosynthesis [Pseudomonas psychrotolerans]